ncbi:hypothetical protein B0T14DRAFT_519494 [Immersiella caudata]|uniref:Neuroparsin n=1 Tax=Immersiella caudata TaxID=314043 RepID=A0AA39WQ76_9PEZI|nr:hypothetical protein B0T14DRAFT_519494 [Immersiella caudata]
MQLQSLVTIVALLATNVAALPHAESEPLNPIQARACGDQPGRCDKNGCEGVFNNPWDLIGTCTKEFRGCSCRKCNGVGQCSNNGCAGRNGICQGGYFQGCPCK